MSRSVIQQTLRALAAVAAFGLLPACRPAVSSFIEAHSFAYEEDGGARELDGGARDGGGLDAGAEPDAASPDAGLACPSGCPPEAPVCDLASGECVGCRSSLDCAPFDLDRRRFCERESGSCVQCQLGEESACSGAETCDLRRLLCVPGAAGSYAPFERCSNDRQCPEGHYCVPSEYRGAPQGDFCLPATGSGCEPPFQTLPVERESLSERTGYYCSVDEDLTTIDAVLTAFGEECNEDEDCSSESSICREIFGWGRLCTYRCDAEGQCPSLRGAGGCVQSTPSDSYCGIEGG